MITKSIETFYPATRQEWRAWLEEHHQSKESVWLVYYKKKCNIPTILWGEAVDEALCFGWIDSTKISYGEDRSVQFFCKRKPNSVWSKINKEKVARLIAEDLMKPAGYARIETAKQNGSWTVLDKVEKLLIPKDLATAFKNNPGSRKYFTGLCKSDRKRMLQWLVMAKRPETRLKRIAEIVHWTGLQQKPVQFR